METQELYKPVDLHSKMLCAIKDRLRSLDSTSMASMDITYLLNCLEAAEKSAKGYGTMVTRARRIIQWPSDDEIPPFRSLLPSEILARVSVALGIKE